MSLIANIKINIELNMNIYQGSKGKYYIIENSKYKNVLPVPYDCRFPLEWAIIEEENNYLYKYNKLGPYKCYTCKEEGYCNGVFISFCNNCSLLGDEDNNIRNDCWNTYLYNITKDEIGDDFLTIEHEVYKDIPDLLSINNNDNESDLSVSIDLSKNDNVSISYTISDSESLEDWAEVHPYFNY